MKWLVLFAVAIPSAAISQAGPYKLVITWHQSNLTVIDYPNAIRCEAARRAVEAEVDKRSRESQALTKSLGGVVVGTSPNGAFCIPG